MSRSGRILNSGSGRSLKNIRLLIIHIFCKFASHHITLGNGSKLHEVTKLHKGTKLYEDSFASRVSFAKVTFLHDSEKIQIKK